MKSGKDVSYTKDRTPSPAKANQERLARDIQRYTILTKRINRVLSTDSPEWVNWVKDKITVASDKVKDATNYVVDKVKDGFNYVKDKVSSAYEKASGWVGDRIADVKDLVDRGRGVAEDFINNAIDDGERFIDNLNENVKEGVKDALEKPKEIFRDTKETISNTVTNTIQSIGNIINKIDITMPSIEIVGLEALGLLPAAIVTVGELIANLFTFDIDDYTKTMEALEKLTPPMEEVG